MFKEILPTFEKKYNRENKDKLITDDYVLKPGHYFLIRENGIEDMIVSGNKKNLDSERMHILYKLIAQLDYNSSLLSMNKPIDSSKQVHSNNFYSFFFKIENKAKVTLDVIDGYYKILKNPYLKYTKPLQKEMYKSVEVSLGKVDIEKVEKIEKYIKENINSIIDKCKPEKGYIKIFFDVPVEEYVKEGSRYFLSNIYNVVDYNTVINNELYGIPGVNLGCNSDKPNLKFREKAPFLLSLEDALMQKKLADYLGNCASNLRYNIYINEEDIYPITNSELLSQKNLNTDFNGIYLRVQKGKDLEIIDYSIISNFNQNLKGFEINNYLTLDKKNNKIKKQSVDNLKKLELVIDEKYFNKFMINSYFSDIKNLGNLNNPSIRQALINNRESLYTWFYKGDSNRFRDSYKKFTLDLIYNAVDNDQFTYAVERFNIRMSLNKYFGGGDMDLYSKKDKLVNEIDSNEKFTFKEDDEYALGVGQLAAYLTSQSQSSEKTFSLGMPILKASYKNIIDNELKRLFNKYGYRISQNNKRFKRLYTAVLDYKPTKINEEMILAGYMMDNIMYIKNEQVVKETN